MHGKTGAVTPRGGGFRRPTVAVNRQARMASRPEKNGHSTPTPRVVRSHTPSATSASATASSNTNVDESRKSRPSAKKRPLVELSYSGIPK